MLGHLERHEGDLVTRNSVSFSEVSYLFLLLISVFFTLVLLFSYFGLFSNQEDPHTAVSPSLPLLRR